MKIVYWSGTGNTEKMAMLIAQGVIEAGKIAEVISVNNATSDIFDSEEIIILGCSAMGDEVIEESEFDPFIEEISSKIQGKKVALFGSYGWGDGRWMKEWEERMSNYGCQLVAEGLIVNYEPEDDSKECLDFGRFIAKV